MFADSNELWRIVSSAPGERLPLHRHRDARLILFGPGLTFERSFDGEASFAEGDLLFRPAYYGHANLAGPVGSQYLQLRVPAATSRSWIAEHGWRAGRGFAPLRDLTRLLAVPDAGALLLKEMRGDVYLRPIRGSRLDEAWRDLSADNPRPLGMIAASLHLRPYEFSRRFASEFGLVPRVFRRQAGLQRAMRMLIEDGGGLAGIAAATGFCDQSHLTRCLKLETGLTPGAFARANGR